ncbi:hypothetical protein P9112_008686 [Eukaryota sp. TZLM1-RC]
MNKLTFLVCFIAVASATFGGSTLTENAIGSGFKTTLTQRGVNHIRDILVAEIRKEIGQIIIPNIEGKEHHIKYSVKDIRISNVNFGAVNVVSTGTGVKLSITGVGFDINCNWKAKYHVVSDHGRVDIHVRNTNTGVSLDIAASSDGKPTARSHSPEIHIGHLDVKFHGGVISQFINLFKGSIAKKIRSTAESQVRGQLTTILNQAIQKSLSDVHPIIPIDNYADFDLRLLNINYGQNLFISPAFHGNFLYHGNKNRPALKTNDLPSHINDRHVQIFLSEYVFNSGSYVYFHKGLMKETVTDKDIPQSSWIHLNTKSWRYIIPEMYQKYPDMPMQASIAAQDYPKLTFNSTNVRVYIPAVANISVVTPNGVAKDLVSVGISVETVAKIKLSGMRVHGHIDLVGFKFRVLKSEFVKIDEKEINKVINDLCKYGVVPFFNPALEKGLEIPVTKGVTIKKPTLDFGKGFVAITSDIDYKF